MTFETVESTGRQIRGCASVSTQPTHTLQDVRQQGTHALLLGLQLLPLWLRRSRSWVAFRAIVADDPSHGTQR